MTFDERLVTTTSEIFDGCTTNWEDLYCSHLWSSSQLRQGIINDYAENSNMIKYCYSMNGKIRKYEIKSPNDHFKPNTHSTPNCKYVSSNSAPVDPNARYEIMEDTCSVALPYNRSNTKDVETSATESNNSDIPTISQHVDASFRENYSSYGTHANTANHQRLRKSLKGIGCVVSLALADSPVKTRTQIQACSITLMIVAIVVISFVLVNFTSPNIKSNMIRPTAVPTEIFNANTTSTAISNLNLRSQQQMESVSSLTSYHSTTVQALVTTSESSTKFSDVLAKIRKNIRTYPKDAKNSLISADKKPKEINSRDLSLKFCSCQIDEVCMLDENSGTALCKKATDMEDPTGKLCMIVRMIGTGL